MSEIAAPDESNMAYRTDRYKLLQKYGDLQHKHVWNAVMHVIDCQQWQKNI